MISRGDKIALAALFVAILGSIAAWLSVPGAHEQFYAWWTSNDKPITYSRGTPFYTRPDFFPNSAFIQLTRLPTGANEVNDKESSAVKREDGLNWSWPARGFIAQRRLGPLNPLECGVVARSDSPILAMASGTVYEVGIDIQNHGVYLKIRHSNLFSSNYLIQNGVIKVSEGQKVKRGALIAVRMDSKFSLVVFFQMLRSGKLVDASAFLPPLSLPQLETSPAEPGS
jgi:Peptidase family M23